MKKFYQLTNKSFTKFKVKNYKELWKKVKGKYKGISVCVSTEFKQIKKKENKFDVVMSTSTEDRHGDIVEQNWDLKNFKKNPVFLDSHNYGSIEHILGKVNKAKAKDGTLIGQIEYALDSLKGLLAFKLTKGGFLHTVSVGFIPKEFEEKTGKILKSELLELSAVSVPANPEALIEKSKKKKLILKEVVVKKNSRLEALKNIASEREEKRISCLKEVSSILNKLSEKQVETQERRQMCNRAIRQLIKAKN
ncbi:MAG: HK97 family phage prohead protease [Candidatus Heimdallarchaeaceae archaeon]